MPNGIRKPGVENGEAYLARLADLGVRRTAADLDPLRGEARSEVFDYIESFYNRVRRHKHLDQLSPHEFERQRQTAL